MTFPFRGWRLALSALSGLAMAFAFPTHSLPILGWVSLAALLCASIDAGVGHAALCGFVHGAVLYLISIPWIYTVLQQYGPMPAWQAVGLLLLLIAALSMFVAAFTGVIAFIAKRNTALALTAAPFIWVALELLRMHFGPITFPWDLLGYTASPSLALVQVTTVTGIWGLSLLVAAYNALTVWALRAPSAHAQRRGRKIWAGATALLAAAVLFGGRFVPRDQPTHVAHLVQTNLLQALEYPANWEALHAQDMAELDNLSLSANAGGETAGLVVWPEVPAPFSLQQAGFAQRAARIAAGAQSYFLVGEIDWKTNPGGTRTPYNSTALIAPSGREEFLYDKIHLVPFGEFIPWRAYLFFARELTGLVGDFGVGTRHAVGDLPGGKFGVFICYEAIFPDHVRQFVQNGAGLLVNLSNDGWFGPSSARVQHLAQARVRAVENRRWLLRDTNNGLTASVDPYGRVAASLAPDIRGRLDAPYAFREDRTLYTRWGDWVAYLAVVMSALLLLAALTLRAAPVASPARRSKQSKERTK